MAVSLCAIGASAQGVRYDQFSWSTSPVGLSATTAIVPLSGATVNVCSSPAVMSGGACTNKTTTYSDITLATPCGSTTQLVLQGTISCVAASDVQGNFGFWLPPGTYTYTVCPSVGSCAGPFTITLQPTLGSNNNWGGAQNFKSVNNQKYAAGYGLADFCANIMAAKADLGSTAGIILLDQSAGTGPCAAGITLGDNQYIVPIQPGSYNLGTNNIVTGNHSGILCQGDADVFVYSGTGFAVDPGTVNTPTIWGWCKFSLASTAAGGIRLTNTGNSFETQALIQAVIVASTRTAGQIGVQLKSTTATSSIYHSQIDIRTFFMDYGIEFVSTVNNQGPDGNTVHIQCNKHTVCVQHMDGTDNTISGMVLGADVAGIGFNFCATGNGGYGSANNIIAAGASSEQGGASTSLQFNSGAGLTVGCGNNYFGPLNANDATQVTDNSASGSNMGCTHAACYNLLMAGGSCLTLGGARSAAAAQLCRNGTALETKLGDGSADATHIAKNFQSSVATGTAPLIVASTTPVSNLNTAPTTYNAAGTQTVSPHVVSGTCTLGTSCAVLLSGSAVFSNAATYTCAVADQTGIFAARVVNSSGSAFTITGNATDVIGYSCIGN